MKIKFTCTVDIDISAVHEIIEENGLTTSLSNKELNEAIRESLKRAFKCAINSTLDNTHLDINVIGDLKRLGILKESEV